MAGYSSKSLSGKLGIKEGYRLIFIHEPDSLKKNLEPLPQKIMIAQKLEGFFDFIHLFTKERIGLENIFSDLKNHLKQNGMIWISWPKKAAKIPTDLDENIVRNIGLECGLVDVKVCAIDEIWSGLKFMIRVKDRHKT